MHIHWQWKPVWSSKSLCKIAPIVTLHVLNLVWLLAIYFTVCTRSRVLNLVQKNLVGTAVLNLLNLVQRHEAGDWTCGKVDDNTGMITPVLGRFTYKVMSSPDDSKTLINFLARVKTKVPVYYRNFVLERTESWRNRKATTCAMIVSQA
jgi:hypothetical protein